MKKLILTAIIAFSMSSLLMYSGSVCKNCAPALAKSAMLVDNYHNILATAD